VPRALLLDFDQTLVDTHGGTDWCGALADLRSRFGPLQVPSLESCALRVIAVLVAEADPDRWAAMSASVEAYELVGATRATLMPYGERLLQAARHLPKGIVTSGTAATVQAALARLGISVGTVVGRERGVGMKPAPDQVLAALQRLGVAPGEALMAGDSPWDEEAARAAGVRFVGIGNGRDAPGFAPGTAVARDLGELADLLASGAV
jgi:HAD superfamily hydrolase (TIGR01549 family)